MLEVIVGVTVGVRVRVPVAVTMHVAVTVLVRVRVRVAVCGRTSGENLAMDGARTDERDRDSRNERDPRVDGLGNELTFEQIDRHAERDDADRMREWLPASR